MSHRRFLLMWLVLFLLSSMPVAGIRGEERSAEDRPNIVFLFTDDQAPWALGESGHAYAVTPNLDRLVQEGAYLPLAFTTTPVCSPSRAGLMTSRYGSEVGITDWIHPQREPELGLDPEWLTWPEVLQDAGYTTALVGKWHLGIPDRFHPTRTGFDTFMGFRAGGAPTENPRLEEEGEERVYQGLTTDILTDRALAFLRQVEDRPFLLCLHYRAPHTRWLPVADEDWAPFADLDPDVPHPDYPNLDVARVKRMTREYLASVAGVDRNVGRVLEALRELDLEDNTVVIFSSDHGYSMGHNGIWHKGNGHWVLTEPPPATENIPRNQRPNMYDNSLLVPTCVRWPGRITPGTRVERVVTNLDWYPTILAMAGLQVPEGVTVRGRNFLPLLEGEALEWDDELFAQYSTHHQSQTHMRALRTPEWKLVRDFRNPDRDELYHLAEDPEERVNLLPATDTETRRIAQELHGRLLERMQEIRDPILPD